MHDIPLKYRQIINCSHLTTLTQTRFTNRSIIARIRQPCPEEADHWYQREHLGAHGYLSRKRQQIDPEADREPHRVHPGSDSFQLQGLQRIPGYRLLSQRPPHRAAQ